MAAERALATGLLALGLGNAAAQELAPTTAWPEVARQGITRIVIVPLAQAREREAYARQIARLCPDLGSSCFINFYTNTTGAELATPLPDAVWQEPTAVYRRSVKQGAELFRWSCRLALEPATCF